jgi:hypothetical protein
VSSNTCCTGVVDAGGMLGPIFSVNQIMDMVEMEIMWY